MTQQDKSEMTGEGQAGQASEEAAQQPLTCSIREFAAIVGISRDHAYELAHSEFPPPGFKVGKGYRVIRSRIPEYIDQLYERELAARKRRR